MGNCISDLTEPPFQTPVAKIEKCELGEMSLLSGINIEISLVIKNPNSKSLMMDEVFYKLSNKSDGTVLAEDTVIRRELIRPDSMKVVTVPVKMGYFGMGKSAKSMFVRGATKIDIVGTVTFEAAASTGDKEINVPFNGDWEIQMSG